VRQQVTVSGRSAGHTPDRSRPRRPAPASSSFLFEQLRSTGPAGTFLGSVTRVARRRALTDVFDHRRGAPAPSSRSVRRLPTDPIAPAREAVAKEESK
jgi:hypothetical protein